MVNKALYSSRGWEWETPPDFFDRLDRKFGLNFDVCATPWTAKCSNYFTQEDNALELIWRGRCFMNPPYGREIGKWLKKAHESRETAEIVVCLIPARTDTRWWHDYVMRSSEIIFVKGRLTFYEGGLPSWYPAPFPSAVVVFRDGEESPVISAMDSKET